MENFKEKDYQFSTEIANTGYKFYSEDLNQIGSRDSIPSKIKYLIVESRLSQELIQKLDYLENCEVLEK